MAEERMGKSRRPVRSGIKRMGPNSNCVCLVPGLWP
jgi:hypothetical protein